VYAADNNLMWFYDGTLNFSDDTVEKSFLSKAVLWSALGEVYKRKAEMETEFGDHKRANEDVDQATNAFRNALNLNKEIYGYNMSFPN
jgi:hypothetical protein